ncbi:MAG TPA: serine/threonine-protein kinase [Kofleriaceae bacterium]|nr:serine/threonine-protein kinase [Kofleriaceae bacterium]
MCLAIYRTAFQRCPRDGGLIRPVAEDPLVGKVVGGRYHLAECVGEGAMGRVYRATHDRLSRHFAVKILYGELAADDNMRSRFAQEAELASRLDDPRIVSVIDFGETEHGLLYLVMDFVDGETLAELLEREAPLPASRMLELAVELCAGLEHAHAAGLVHRDFKPDNVVLVERGGRLLPRILDFGLAITEEPSKSSGRFTTAGIVVGTPAYISPEQASGAELDHRADLYSLGVVFYEMLSGKVPFRGTAIELARANVGERPPRFAERVPGLEVAAPLEALVLRMLEKSPADRVQSAGEIRRQLGAMSRSLNSGVPEAVASSAELSAGLRGLGSRGPRWAVPALVVILALALSAGALIFYTQNAGSGSGGQASLAEAVPAGTPWDAGLSVDVATSSLVKEPAIVAVDAAVAAASPPADAAVRETPAKPAKHPVRPGRAAEDKPSKPTPPGPVDPVSTSELTEAYRRVAQLLERAESALGKPRVAPYRARYLEVPFADALRKPERRADTMKALRALEREVRGLE